jgi:hypothetical protein
MNAEDLYRALLTTGRLPVLRRLTYRCVPRRCLLLDAVDTPLGIVLHQTRYKYSEPENLRRSNAAGRARSTYDDNNHWRERTYYLADSPLSDPEGHRLTPELALEARCDHVLSFVLTAPGFRDDWDARHAEFRVRPDQSRYAVD